MSEKYYVVKKGHKIGIYKTWDKCKKQVLGYPGAVYKKFMSLDEANDFLNSEYEYKKTNNKERDTSKCEKESCSKKIQEPIVLDKYDVVAYVDGSYNIRTKEFSYGMVIMVEDEEKYFKEKYKDVTLRDMRNVAGEIMGSMSAMKYCMDNGYKSVIIHFDYEGIEKWCTGAWKTNKIGTKKYKEFYDSLKDKIHITFKKVKAHSGDKYNDIADRLAKSALGL